MYALLGTAVGIGFLVCARVLLDPWPPLDSVRALGAPLLTVTGLRFLYEALRLHGGCCQPIPVLGYLSLTGVLLAQLVFVVVWARRGTDG